MSASWLRCLHSRPRWGKDATVGELAPPGLSARPHSSSSLAEIPYFGSATSVTRISICWRVQDRSLHHICNMDLWSLGLWSGFDVDYHARMFNLLPANNSWPRTARMWPNAKLQPYLNLAWNIMGCFVYFFISFGNSIAQVSILNFCGWQGTRKPKGCFLSPGWSWKVNSILFPDLRFSFLIEPTLGRIKRGWAQKRLGMRIYYPIWTSVC